MKSIKPDEFFKLVSVNSGVTDLQTVKDIYYGMIKTISRELKSKHAVKLPLWGEFLLKIMKARKTLNVNTRVIEYLPAKPVVKFEPDYKVKDYFYALGNDEGTMLK